MDKGNGRHGKGWVEEIRESVLSQALQNRIGAVQYNMIKDMRNVEAIWHGQTIGSNHLGRMTEVMSRSDGSKLK